MIPIKKDNEIVKMREVNKIVGDTLKYLETLIKPGVSVLELDALAEKFILERDAKPNFKNYRGYPATLCVSINDVVVHGIPKEGVTLKEGDIVSIDMGALKNGFHGDAARTFPVGKISQARQKLIDVTKQSFFEGIKHAKEGRRLGDISNAIQLYAEQHGYGVVRALTGHGIGRQLHEEPNIPNYGAKGSGPVLKSGYTLAIEPMINAGHFAVKFESDGWTCRTFDGSDSAHYENTILITGGEPEILTM